MTRTPRGRLAQLHANGADEARKRALHDVRVVMTENHVAFTFVRTGWRLARPRQLRLDDQPAEFLLRLRETVDRRHAALALPAQECGADRPLPRRRIELL